MKKFTLLFACLLMLGVHVANAQQRTITGTVTSSDDGMALPGVTVSVKGTTTGTITDVDGKYMLGVGADAQALVFSFVGMATQEVAIGSSDKVDVVLEPDVIGVDEVVVTALGIKKSKKALGYAVTEVKSEELERVQVIDATHALQGKVAGVDISPSSGAPGASTRVLIRGISSVTGNNQPLYVIDGVPVNNQYTSGNSTAAATTVTRTVDFGNAASDINPADIESINILKGAAATSLYGARAANGVVVITTKSGKKGQKMKVNFSSSASVNEVGRLPYYQDRFGQGWSGHFAFDENGSWGPVMDGQDRLIGNIVNNSQRLMPFEYQENGMRDFYEYGYSLNNSLSISGGTENGSYYVSYANTQQDGVVPGPVDVLDRNNFSFKASGGTDKTQVTFSASYTNKKMSSVATGQSDDAGGGKVLFQELLQNPVNHYIPLYRDYENDFDNLDNFYTPYAQNPYFIINENGNDFKQDRLISSLNITQEVFGNLSVAWRGGLDHYSNFYNDYGAIAKITPGAPNSSANDVAGGVTEEGRTVTELNSDFFINYDGVMDVAGGKLEYDVVIGNNINDRYNKRHTTVSKGLVVPEYYNVQNISGSPEVSTFIRQERTVGLFGTLSLNFNDYLFAQLTARNDWSSTLPKENNSFFYPGINLGFIFSEFIPSNNILKYGKVRASYAMAGNGANPYSLDAYYNAAVLRNGGYGVTNYPVGGIAAYEKNLQLGNPDLVNELSKEFEIGTDLRFVEGRVGVDVAYYQKSTVDLIFTADLAVSTGYNQMVTNLGKLTNKGIELKVDLIPVKLGDFQWDLTYIFNNNNTVLDELSKELGVSEYVINSAYETEFVAMPGEQLGQFRIPDYKYSPDGQIIVGDNGLPLEGDKKLFGSSVPDYKMSLTNRFSYKGLNLNFLLDYQKGGYMYSYTSSITYWSGNNEQSTINDRRPWVIPNSVQEVTADDGTVSYVENSVPVHNNWHEYYSSNTNKPIAEERIIEKTYFRLRELSVNYTIPKSITEKVKLSSASIGVFGKNLFLWTPADNSFIDPESSTWGNDLVGMMGEFGGAPSVRTYGIKLNVTF